MKFGIGLCYTREFSSFIIELKKLFLQKIPFLINFPSTYQSSFDCGIIFFFIFFVLIFLRLFSSIFFIIIDVHLSNLFFFLSGGILETSI